MRERERESGDREVVVMDVCLNCGGIWLDTGELEKLTAAESRHYDSRGREHDDDDDEDRRGGGHGDRFGQRRRRGGFLGNIFEGFGD